MIDSDATPFFGWLVQRALLPLPTWDYAASGESRDGLLESEAVDGAIFVAS
jgi:hypothetical protein